MKRIVLFASGSGSNVENIFQYFQNNAEVTIATVLTNKRDAKVLDRCILKATEPDLIVLAGFLLKVPEKLVKTFPNKIINIHPALLPKYGGKGMYGMNVHNAVKNNKEQETGITIHYVNENYDEGAIIKQAKTKINTEDSAEDIAKKVHQLEYEYFPKIIEQLLNE